MNRQKAIVKEAHRGDCHEKGLKRRWKKQWLRDADVAEEWEETGTNSLSSFRFPLASSLPSLPHRLPALSQNLRAFCFVWTAAKLQVRVSWNWSAKSEKEEEPCNKNNTRGDADTDQRSWRKDIAISRRRKNKTEWRQCAKKSARPSLSGSAETTKWWGFEASEKACWTFGHSLLAPGVTSFTSCLARNCESGLNQIERQTKRGPGREE